MENVGGGDIGGNIEVFDFLAAHPGCHRVYVVSLDVAADPVRFEDWRSTAHEGIGDRLSGEVVWFVVRFREWFRAKFGQHEAAEQAAGPPGKPFMHSDIRAVVLLDLFLSQRV